MLGQSLFHERNLGTFIHSYIYLSFEMQNNSIRKRFISEAVSPLKSTPSWFPHHTNKSSVNWDFFSAICLKIFFRSLARELPLKTILYLFLYRSLAEELTYKGFLANLITNKIKKNKEKTFIIFNAILYLIDQAK